MNLIRFNRHTCTPQQNDKAFVFSKLFTYSSANLWNILPNDTVLAVKQDCFKVLTRKYLSINNN